MFRNVAALSAYCFFICACATSPSHTSEEDPYVVSFRAIKNSVALLSIEGKTPEYGTACVLKSNGHGTYLLTDEHVVAHAGRIKIQIGSRMLGTASVVMRDSRRDVAVLYSQVRNLPTVTLGDSSIAEAGMQIGIAGYPVPDAFDEEHFGVAVSLYAGRIASVRPHVLEVDVPVIPGDSGAPVFEANTGRVIGLGEARFEDERAVGIATPINLIKPLLARYL